MKTNRHDCGCRSERGTSRERWVELCPADKAEADETHARWTRELQERRAAQETLS